MPLLKPCLKAGLEPRPVRLSKLLFSVYVEKAVIRKHWSLLMSVREEKGVDCAREHSLKLQVLYLATVWLVLAVAFHLVSRLTPI